MVSVPGLGWQSVMARLLERSYNRADASLVLSKKRSPTAQEQY